MPRQNTGATGGIRRHRDCSPASGPSQERRHGAARGDRAALAFPIAHLARDCAWAAAIVLWCRPRCHAAPCSPSHSMPRRPPVLRHSRGGAGNGNAIRRGTLLVVIPAFNEATNLPRVVSDVRRAMPAADILVVNDGSGDSTATCCRRSAFPWLTMSERVGVGGAVRAGIRYAARRGYTYVVRVDGDAQHRACDIGRLLAPVLSGTSDAAIGSRFLAPGCWRRHQTHEPVQRSRRFSPPHAAARDGPDFGLLVVRSARARAPGATSSRRYAEPELVLFLSRNAVRVRRSTDPHAAATRRADLTHCAPRRDCICAHGPCAAGRALSAHGGGSRPVTDPSSSSSRSASAQRSWWRSSSWSGGAC